MGGGALDRRGDSVDEITWLKHSRFLKLIRG
jgi:hypothetical protein